MNNLKWIADFETTTAERKKKYGNTQVWACGLCEVGNPQNVIILKTLEEFLEWCEKQQTNDTVYFHNLRFDGNFIIQYLLRHGYTFAATPQEKATKTFTTLISDKSLWYQIEIFFSIKGKNINKVTIQDSLKLIPLSVREIAKSFHLPIKKGSIDYAAHDFLPEGADLTAEEEEYLVHDVQIVEHALNFFHNQGMDKMTIGGCALEEFKKLINKRYFKMYFPPPFYDADVRKAYKGGFTYLNPKFKKKTVGNLVVLDVNSLYPSVMSGCNGEIMPYGTPIFYEGEYKEDNLYPLYIQKIRCSFKLKPNKIPTIQIKHNMYYQGNQYLTSSDGDRPTLYLTSVDLKLFLEQYEVYDIEYCSGWKFKGINAGAIFGDYVNKWSEVKVNSKKEGNHGMYLISKLMLNSLYGKFGSAVEVVSKEPYIGEDDKIHFRKSEPIEKEGVYIAMACFITAYSRLKTITAAQQITDDYVSGKSKIQFVYADTDSLHCVSPDFSLPNLDIHPTKLGAWDHEASAVKGKFLRQKCYMEKHIIDEKTYNKAMNNEDAVKELYSKEGDQYYFTKITVAGMPDSCYKVVTFDNFKIGAKYAGKLKHTTVFGGVVLEDTEFTIKK